MLTVEEIKKLALAHSGFAYMADNPHQIVSKLEPAGASGISAADRSQLETGLHTFVVDFAYRRLSEIEAQFNEHGLPYTPFKSQQ